MSERERRVNLQLNTLDDAHRMGRMPRDEYRQRRRDLLASLSEETGTTRRDTVRRPAPAGKSAGPAGRARPASRWRQRAVSLGVLGVVCVGLALFCWLRLRTV